MARTYDFKMAILSHVCDQLIQAAMRRHIFKQDHLDKYDNEKPISTETS